MYNDGQAFLIANSLGVCFVQDSAFLSANKCASCIQIDLLLIQRINELINIHL